MTTELVTGKQGKPHIDGDDVGSLTAAIAGHGDYLLQRADGTWPAITMQDANHALIPTLNLLVEGRYAPRASSSNPANRDRNATTWSA